MTSFLPMQMMVTRAPPSLSSSASLVDLHQKLSSLSFDGPSPGISKVIHMGGGPRTYPGGVSKWQWKRMQAKKQKQLLKARLSRERQIYEMRKRAELKAAVAELERPWEPVEKPPNLFSISADEQLKVLADRFQQPGGFDLWSERDGPQLFETVEGLPSARFFPKGVVHSVKPYGKIEGSSRPNSGTHSESKMPSEANGRFRRDRNQRDGRFGNHVGRPNGVRGSKEPNSDGNSDIHYETNVAMEAKDGYRRNRNQRGGRFGNQIGRPNGVGGYNQLNTDGNSDIHSEYNVAMEANGGYRRNRYLRGRGHGNHFNRSKPEARYVAFDAMNRDGSNSVRITGESSSKKQKGANPRIYDMNLQEDGSFDYKA